MPPARVRRASIKEFWQTPPYAGGAMHDSDPRIRELRSPLSARDLRPLEPAVAVVQFCEPLQDHEYRAVAALVTPRPDVNVRAYGDYGKRFTNLAFLRHLTGIRGLQIDLPHLEDVAGLDAVLGDLERFSWGWTYKTFSLAPLSGARKLTELHLEKHQKNIETVAALTGLRRLSLRSIRGACASWSCASAGSRTSPRYGT
jgi:hypothetical protein